MSKLAQNTRRTISAAVTIVTAGYLVAVCVVLVMLISPIYLARRLERQLSMAE
jgi:hypothetical protein